MFARIRRKTLSERGAAKEAKVSYATIARMRKYPDKNYSRRVQIKFFRMNSSPPQKRKRKIQFSKDGILLTCAK
jgi:hypothetical protein